MHSIHRHLFTALVLLAAPLFTGCGILAIPFTIGTALQNNRPVEVRGTVVDENSRPLSAVIMKVETTVETWDPAQLIGFSEGFPNILVSTGMSWDHPVYNLQISHEFDWHGKVEIQSYHGLTLAFSKPGYYNRQYVVQNGREISILRTHDPDFKVSDDPTALHVVLIKKGAITQLESQSATLWLMGDGSRVTLSSEKLDSENLRLRAIGPTENPPAHCLYLTASRDSRGIVKNANDDALPAELHLGIAGQGDGLILYHPQHPYDVLLEMREAPTQGYTSEIPWPSDPKFAADGKIWFYLKSAGQFGRGYIKSNCTCGSDGHSPHFEAEITLFLQRDGSANLETGD